MKDKSIFWDINQTLSYNALFNFIVGNRGAGKTFGAKQWCIDDYLKNGNQFVWARRYDSEFDDFKTLRGKDAFFSDIRQYYENDFSYANYNFYNGEDIMGYAIPLSVSAKKKSSSYPNVNKLILDEFIIDKGRSNYLNKEVEIFLDLYETVFRMRENIKGVFFLANAITFTNPYFLYFNVNKPLNKKGIMRQGDILIQLVQNEAFIETKKKTRFGKLIDGTEYGNYAIDNQFLRDSNEFILDHRPNDLSYLFTIKAGGEMYGVWVSHGEGIMFISRKFDPSFKIIFTTILDNHEPNTMFLKGNSSSLFNYFVNAFKMGRCYFDSVKTKNIVLDTIKGTL